MEHQLTISEVLGAVNDHLEAAGFSVADELLLSNGDPIRCFEDALSIVGVVGFNTWATLERRWQEAQDSLVELMSDRLSRSDPKSWAGYLLLVTVDAPPSMMAVDVIRRDTTRVRKLVATGNDLTTIGTVERVLLPLLPLETERTKPGAGRLLDRLPQLVEGAGVDPALMERVVLAFDENRTPMEEIWRWRQAQ